MRNILLPVIALFSALLFLSLQKSSDKILLPAAGRVRPENPTGCAPPLNFSFHTDVNGKWSPVFPGWGHYSYRVHTTQDSAQFYFDQGLNLYYSYHLAEAFASFREAARWDKSCAMAYWGQALAMGPYYNNYFYKMPIGVLPVLEEMNRLAATAPVREKDLIGVMNERYSADTSDSRRPQLNKAYSAGLAALIAKYPGDADIKALYVDAVMLEHTWDFWDSKGQPKPWTTQLVAYCDEILRIHPTHPAALHYQIHLVEASFHPEKALHNADVLQMTMPGVSHMVHMASHMYQRNGLYAKGVRINDRADKLQRYYDSIAPDLKLGSGGLIHFYSVQSYCAMNAGMFQTGAQVTLRCRNTVKAQPKSFMSRCYFQYLYMMPVFNCIRSGKWEAILAEPAPDSSLHYARLLDDFAKGLASLRLNDTASARSYLDRLRMRMSAGDLMVRNLPFNAPIEGARIAEGILNGEILFSEKKYKEAISALTSAAIKEDDMIYREPKDWPLPVRHYLGACLLKMGRAAEAESIYRKELVYNPGNGWALLGLYQSLVMQHQGLAARPYRAAYLRAFSNAEALPPASAF